MKSIGFALFCLLCTVAWAEDEVEGDEAAAQPIAFTVFTVENDKYGLGLNDKVNWYQAELICRSAGFTLVNIPSEIIQFEIEGFLSDFASDYLQLLANTPVWTSGSNQGANSQYVWNSNGRRIGYHRFLASLPTSTRCIGYNIATNFWSHHDCRDQRYFLCQKFELETC